MSIRLKLIAGGVVISLLIAGVLAMTITSFGTLSEGLLEGVGKSVIGVDNSRSTEQSVIVADENLAQVSADMLAVVDDINETNMQVKVLERKVKIISATLVELTEEIEGAVEGLPESDIRYTMEDLNDAVGDIEETMRREALVSLTFTVDKMKHFTEMITTQVDDINQLSGELGKVKGLSANVVLANQEIRTLSENFGGEIGTSRNAIASVLLVITVIALVGALLLTRTITRPLNRANQIARGIADGDLDQVVDIEGTDEVGQLGVSMSVMIKNLKEDIEATRKRADEASRIRMALDVCSTNVVVADTQHKIIYQNQSSADTLARTEESLRGDLSNLRADAFMGTNLYEFHTAPEQQQIKLQQSNASEQEDLKIGDSSLRLITTPVFNDSDERLGVAMEWTDRTEEVAMEAEVEEIVNAAHSGDLSGRINTEGKQGFFLNLSSGINALIGQVEVLFTDLSEVMSAMADGDLTQPIQRTFQGSFEELKGNVNGTITNLSEIIGQLRSAMGEVNSSASEISAGNNSLSGRTEQQASALEETAASMEELTSTVRETSGNAQQANSLAQDAKGKADSGGEIVSRAVTAMGEISESSGKISEIISVIDSIAFQTNLLALNASVEAARAGEQGRGFAVVAQEVRELAGRSAAAAKQIKVLIGDSGEKVEMGTELVNESGEMLSEIVTAVKKVGDIIAEIDVASREQLAGIDQVNGAVTSMEEGTQQNAALAEETSAAAISMTEKSNDVDEMVRRFKT